MYEVLFHGVINFYIDYLEKAGASMTSGHSRQLPSQVLVEEKAPPGSGGAPHYILLPTQL
jgi:hypothetical protein